MRVRESCRHPPARGADLRGLLALLAGGAAIAFAPIAVRIADVSPPASAFWRVAFALLALVPAAAWQARRARSSADAVEDRVHPGPGRSDRASILAGLFFAGDLTVWHLAIIWTTVANATLEANFAPVVVALAAWAGFGQRVGRSFVVALIVSMTGAMLLIGPHVGAAGPALRGDALGCLTAVFYAGYMLAVAAASRTAPTLRIACVATAVAAMALLPWAAVMADRFWPHSAAGWLVLAGMGLVSHAGGQTLIAYGLWRVAASIGSVTLLVQPILAAIYAAAFLGERIGPVEAAGAVVVLIGIAMARRTARTEPCTTKPDAG